jgi:phage terminase large subunit-like protein
MAVKHKFTKEELLADLLRRVREERADFYKPHPGQLEFHKAVARIRAVFAGNRWGKTYGLAMEIFWHVSKTHPHWEPLAAGPIKARVCSVDYQTSVKSMIDDTFKVLVPRRYLKGNSWDTAFSKEKMTLYFKNGGFIEFMSYNQDVEAYAGVARHIIWEDEEPPEEIHRENMARLSTTKGIMIMSMTPVRPQMWVVSEIYEKAEKDDNILVFKGVATENPFVDPETIDLMLSQINDPVERASRLSGDFTWYAGKIYPAYTDSHRVEYFEPPREWELVVAIDPHDTKETAVTFGYWNLTGELYIMDELWCGGDWQKIANEIRVLCKGRTPTSWIIDPSSDRDPKIHGTDSIYKKFLAIFPDLAKWTSHPGSVWMGIQDVKGMMKLDPVSQLPKIFVCDKNCPMTDWQLAHYGLRPPTAADQYRYEPKPMKIKDDFCDCVRGTVMHGSPIADSRMKQRMFNEDRFEMRSYV